VLVIRGDSPVVPSPAIPTERDVSLKADREGNWMEGHTWRAPDGPPEDAVRPHVLVLPHDQPEVLAYFDSVRQVVNPYVDIVAPVAEPDLHWTVQGAQSRDATGAYVGIAIRSLSRDSPARSSVVQVGKRPVESARDSDLGWYRRR
jgi:hypothetical protein